MKKTQRIILMIRNSRQLCSRILIEGSRCPSYYHNITKEATKRKILCNGNANAEIAKLIGVLITIVLRVGVVPVAVVVAVVVIIQPGK